MDRTIIKIYGKDTQTFLQNLITNNLNLCTEETPIYSCLLNPKGRYQFDFFVIKKEDYFLIDIAQSQYESFVLALKYRKLISKVDFEILQSYKVYNTNNKVDDSIISYLDPRLDVLGYRTVSLNEISSSNLMLNYNEIRYNNAIAEGIELAYDKSIPIEFGMDELGALAYNKGCYLGQEFTNSAKNRMAIRKRVISVFADFDLIKDDTITNESGTEVGKIISSIGKNALALFKMPHKNENIFINGKPVEKHIPSWIKVYSME